MLSPRLWLAPIALFALQASPVLVATDSAGQIRLTFGGGLGEYQERLVSCSGETLDQYDVRYQQVGGQMDVWIKPKLRVTGYGGAMFSHTDRPVAQQFESLYQGGYGGALVAGEWRVVGAGAGLSLMPGDPQTSGGTAIHPAAYLRLGHKEKAHFRMDLFGPPGAAAPPQGGRIGVGFGQGNLRKIGGFVGFGIAPFPRSDNQGAIVGDLLVPATRALDVGGTFAGSGSGFTMGVMVRMSLGKTPK